MRVKLAQLIEAKDSFKKLISMDLAARFAFRLGRMAKALSVHQIHFEEVRNTAIQKYSDGKVDEKNQIHVLPESVQAYMKEVNDLLNEEVEVLCDRVDLSALSEMKVSALDIVALEPFVKFFDEEEGKPDCDKPKNNR